MRVALGTIDVDDDARKAIRKLNGGKGDATRGEVKDYLLSKIDGEVIPNLLNEQDGSRAAADTSDDTPTADGTDAEEPAPVEEQLKAEAHVEPDPPHTDEELPEVPGPGTATGYTGGATATTGTAGTTPTTGNLGDAGTPGGTA